MSAKGGDRLTPFLAKIRDFLLQRKYNNSLRYADGWSKRTQPPCFLPEGANANIANNYYYMRDMRRNEVKKPDTIFEAGPKLLTESAKSSEFPLSRGSVGAHPGDKHDWDQPLQI
ncbi:unnamed protein product [Dicrocoelium dendriticum]|nr:unnamed protein product [Dicrocoelium dendriticum]